MGMHDPLADASSNMNMPPLMPVDNSRLISAESCQTWTAAAVDSPTVSVERLAIPGKASHEFQKACGSFKSKGLKAAEDHARKAVKIYPDYAAAWVLLGQILQEDHKDQEAIDACRQGKEADPQYAPPYICLAGFAARADHWDEAYSLSSHALALDPATDPYAFLYTATADFHLNRMEQAELYARSAEKLDRWHRIPEVHLLLAKLDAVKGDRTAEAAELRQFLKNSPHNSDWQTAKTKLATLEDQASTK
jgi:tetratricopeptide (TPR) repeat protein